MSITIWTPDKVQREAEKCATDFGRFAFNGFGIMLSDEQLQARQELGRPGPRESPMDPRFYWVSGGQRSGKTVFGFLAHAEAVFYKVGVDVTDRIYWKNYQYKTLNIAPSDELSMRLWATADAIQKGVGESQWDRRARRARGGAFLPYFKADTQKRWGIIRFNNGGWVDFRSSEGKAKRLEGTFWRFFTWDEWASQPDGEIRFVLDDVLQGRARDTDAKIMPMAWPKAETERHLIAIERALETGVGRHARDSRVIYISAENAHFTNRAALAVERENKDDARWKRTVLGRTAGGAAVEFTVELTQNMVNHALPLAAPREDGYRYFSSWDLGLGGDSTAGLTWRIPIVDGRPIVTTLHKARIVHESYLEGGEDLTLDRITFEIIREQQAYGSLSAVDATGMGGLGAVRALRNMKPSPLAFKSRSQDRIHGNMRLAAITNGLDLVSWGKPSDEVMAMHKEAGTEPPPWGVIEMPRLVEVLDELANFDRDAKTEVADDRVWAFLIGAWYIRRYWVQLGGTPAHVAQPFDPRPQGRKPPRVITRVVPAVDNGIRYVKLVQR